jgi:rhamnosyltransferase
MNSKNICAILVTFDFDNNFYSNFEGLYHQVDQVVIIDNGDGHQLSELQKLKNNYSNLDVIYNGNNNGIAGALNRGIQYAKEKNFKYIITMDQDSTVSCDMVNKLLETLVNNSLNSIGPNFDNSLSDNELIYKSFLITSGNLVELSTALAVGGYDNTLFIDSVDMDFCLKLKKNGYRFAMARDIRMEHKLGKTVEGKFLFFKKELSFHGANRQYYAFRNLWIMIERYKHDFWFYTVKLRIAITLHLIEIYLFYPKDSKKEIIKKIKQGKRDAKKITHEKKD